MKPAKPKPPPRKLPTKKTPNGRAKGKRSYLNSGQAEKCVHLSTGVFQEAMATITITASRPEFADAVAYACEVCPFCTGTIRWSVPQILTVLGPEPLHKREQHG
jgi:Fe-S oxidoreductase